MKKVLLILLIGTAITVLTTSFNSPAPPRLYPELEAYFKSIDSKQLDKNHYESLENIKYAIKSSNLDYADWNLVFYCSENTFRSQASQVFAGTLCYTKRYKNIKVHSAGLKTGQISTKLIDYLIKIGYKIEKKEKDGQSIYTVRFSDNADPIILYSKTTTDNSLPKKDLTSVVVCDTVKETDCAPLQTESSPFHLPFEKTSDADGNEKVATTVNKIAAEIIYLTNK